MVIEDNEKALALIDPAGFKKITIEQLNDLGFELTGRQLSMGQPARFGIMEVMHENCRTIARFSYLYSLDDQTGVILPDLFEVYYRRGKRTKN